LKSAILQSRYRAAALANGEMLSLYFGIGEYISKNSRKGFWGTGAIDSIAQHLQQELPGLRGFSAANIKKMRQFYEEWSPTFNSSDVTDKIRPLTVGDLQNLENNNNTNRSLTMSEIIVIEKEPAVNRSLLMSDLQSPENEWFPFEQFLKAGFTHHCEIFMKEKSIDARLFYIQKCATEFWSVEKLRYNLQTDLYNKQGTMPNNFTQTIASIDFQRAATQAFKDEYLLDFVNITDADESDERVLENEIVLNIKKFIMALGSEFSFIGNQYRMEVDEKEYFIDLLFFNRKIQSLVAVELKRGEFKPEYAGKLNFYLSVLDDLVRMPHENLSIGIILCKSQRQKTVEYAFRDTSKPIGVATYKLTKELPVQYDGILPSVEKLKELL
jgi:predicted nuclease of restriction endonuclease-like (RecB) superfamily